MSIESIEIIVSLGVVEWCVTHDAPKGRGHTCTGLTIPRRGDPKPCNWVQAYVSTNSGELAKAGVLL